MHILLFHAYCFEEEGIAFVLQNNYVAPVALFPCLFSVSFRLSNNHFLGLLLALYPDIVLLFALVCSWLDFIIIKWLFCLLSLNVTIFLCHHFTFYLLESPAAIHKYLISNGSGLWLVSVTSLVVTTFVLVWEFHYSYTYKTKQINTNDYFAELL